MTAPSRAWQSEGACYQIGGDAWFPVQGEENHDRWAKALCKGCPVRVECLAYAMHFERGTGHTQRHGLWGGLSPTERARLARCQVKADKSA